MSMVKAGLILVVLVLQIANVHTKYRETIIAFLETSDLHDKTNLFHWKHVIVTLTEYMYISLSENNRLATLPFFQTSGYRLAVKLP